MSQRRHKKRYRDMDDSLIDEFVYAVLVIGIALLMFAGQAKGDRWPAADVQRAVVVADSHWPDSPCFGHHEITWETGAAFDTEFPPPDVGGAMVVGYGMMNSSCRVWVAWDRIFELPQLCSVLVHEFGHNAGMDHSPDPANIMHSPSPLAPECVAAFSKQVRARKSDTAPQRQMMSTSKAHEVIHFVYNAPAKTAGGHVVISRCWRSGYKRVCHVHITGHAPQDLRIRVWWSSDGKNFWIDAADWRRR